MRSRAIETVASLLRKSPITILIDEAACSEGDAATLMVDALLDAGWTLTPPEVVDDDDGEPAG